jgi:hypothetical protein
VDSTIKGAFMKSFALVLLLAIALRVSAQECSGPTYPCAMRQTNAQFTTIPLPSVPFSGLIGANAVATIQPYNTTLLRCTDVNTEPLGSKHSFEVTDSGGSSEIQWNVDQTLLRIVRMTTGSTGIIGFNKTSNECTTMNINSLGAEGAVWSTEDPAVDFIPSGVTAVNKRTFDPANPLKAPAITKFFDFKSCPIWPTLNITWDSALTTVDDDLFMKAFSTTGGQDTGTWAVAYRVSTGACSILNTANGIVTASYGMNGVLTGSVTTFFPFSIHNAIADPSGHLWLAVGSTCVGCPKHGPFIWYPGSNRLDLITVSIGGHNSNGYDTWLNFVNSPAMASRKLENINTVTIINSPRGVKFPLPGETHMGWQNVNLTDTNPICMTEVSQNQPQPLVISSPLQQEVFCVDVTDGTYIRLAPTFTSGITSPYNFRTVNAISSNGKQGYIAFSSDMMGQLGNMDGKTSTCKLGAAVPNSCRSDVFIVVPH